MRRFVIALAMLSSVAISAPAIGAPLTITVGSLASLSGSARDYGSSQARGASLYAAKLRSATSPLRIRLPLADDQSSNVMATNQMIAFVGARVSVVLGPTLSGAAAAADPTASATRPQAIFFAARSDEAMQLAQAAAGISVVRVGGNGYNTPDVLKAAGAATDGMIVSASWNVHRTDRASRTFVAQYKARYPGDEPDAFAAQAYAGMRLLLLAPTAS